MGDKYMGLLSMMSEVRSPAMYMKEYLLRKVNLYLISCTWTIGLFLIGKGLVVQL